MPSNPIAPLIRFRKELSKRAMNPKDSHASSFNFSMSPMLHGQAHQTKSHANRGAWLPADMPTGHAYSRWMNPDLLEFHDVTTGKIIEALEDHEFVKPLSSAQLGQATPKFVSWKLI
ncbi:hypothetical protein Fmac_032270 [Flemingia macrophylla]|uniref:Uncharacterized protein n=1 Tax=Flemingia macrophylla TaxID=520843 RepID=A0ABD1L4F4_9FABA